MSARQLTISVLLCVLLGFPSSAFAADDDCRRADRFGWAVPDHGKLQTGGYLGLITLGVGYSALQVLDADVYYGFVPAAVGGHDIHTLAGRISAHPPGLCIAPNLRWTIVSAGLGVLIGFGRGYFIDSPSPHRSDYYPETALRSFLSLGTELHLLQASDHDAVFASHGVLLELTALDRYVDVWLDNTDVIDAWQAWSLSFGYVASF